MRYSFKVTYEGLKQRIAIRKAFEYKSFKVTYEGLKQDYSIYRLELNYICFKVTYEGLKPQNNFKPCS